MALCLFIGMLAVKLLSGLIQPSCRTIRTIPPSLIAFLFCNYIVDIDLVVMAGWAVLLLLSLPF